MHALLKAQLGPGICTIAILGGKNAVLVQPDVTELALVRTAQASEIVGALLRDEMVPAVVMDGYPVVVAFGTALAMQVDAALGVDVAEQNTDLDRLMR